VLSSDTDSGADEADVEDSPPARLTVVSSFIDVEAAVGDSFSPVVDSFDDSFINDTCSDDGASEEQIDTSDEDNFESDNERPSASALLAKQRMNE
jgi:hypothetical protein